jgi:hypothetical protein
MQPWRFPLCTAALLGACQAPAPSANEAAPVGVAENPTASRPAPSAPASKQTSSALEAAPAAIPARFHGTYDESLEACSGPSQYRLTISAAELRFHESIGVVRNISIEAPDRIRLTADYEGEGESWRSMRKLQLGEGDRRLLVTGDGTSLTRLRCPKPDR